MNTARCSILGAALSLALTAAPSLGQPAAGALAAGTWDVPPGVSLADIPLGVGLPDYSRRPAPLEDFAPFVVSCTTGLHDSATVGFVHGCSPLNVPFLYTGVIESRLIGGGAQRSFFCWYQSGQIVESCGFGDFPPALTIVRHEGYSYAYEEPFFCFFPPSTPLGGFGDWGVQILHD